MMFDPDRFTRSLTHGGARVTITATDDLTISVARLVDGAAGAGYRIRVNAEADETGGIVLVAHRRGPQGEPAPAPILAGAYADTVGHAFHPGRNPSASIDLAVDGAGWPTRHPNDVAGWATVDDVKRIEGSHPVEVRLAGRPGTAHRWTLDTTLLVRSTP